ncbi:MAG: hypothetical protein IKQ41_10050 [Clostridia bacterium]|nr:hypothetical protein [Clostridia bacterium]
MENGVFCVIGAMVGAGFASGREIMAFFSRYGAYSWALIALCAFFMTSLMHAVMLRAESVAALTPKGIAAPLGRAVWRLLFTFTGGAMLAAAGQMGALTVPIRYARELSAFFTLLFCVFQPRDADKIGAPMGKLLIPALIAALILCLRSEGSAVLTPKWTGKEGIIALISALGYGALNVSLSAGVICEAGQGKSKREKRKTALLSGIALGALLLIENSALLLHGEAVDAALPTVLVLNRFGKEGFYLSAAVLYLAVVTTLNAQIRGLSSLLPEKGNRILCFFMTAAASQLGFQGIVQTVYPALGWAAAVLAGIALFGKRAETSSG